MVGVVGSGLLKSPGGSSTSNRPPCLPVGSNPLIGVRVLCFHFSLLPLRIPLLQCLVDYFAPVLTRMRLYEAVNGPEQFRVYRYIDLDSCLTMDCRMI